MDDSRVWSFEEGLWTGSAEHYRELIDDECLMVLPTPPYVLSGEQAVGAVSDTSALGPRSSCRSARSPARKKASSSSPMRPMPNAMTLPPIRRIALPPTGGWTMTNGGLSSTSRRRRLHPLPDPAAHEPVPSAGSPVLPCQARWRAQTSSIALALLARAGGKGALQPVNATSHWIGGSRAASIRQADLPHTAIGYATHHAATLFWAVFFNQWTARRPAAAPLPMLRDAMVMSAIAAAVDYTITPETVYARLGVRAIQAIDGRSLRRHGGWPSGRRP